MTNELTDQSICCIQNNTSTQKPISQVGYKAYCLCRLATIGLSVPPAAVLSTDWFQRYQSCLSMNDRETALPKLFNDLSRLLERGLREFELSHLPLIVRSSATVEGQIGMSCSGLFDTIPVTTSNTVINTIKQVWDSALDEQVQAYLQRFHHQSQMAMGVIIQQLITGQLGGVIHTANAVSGDTSRMLIEYDNWRIGAVVDGKSIPRTIWVDATTEETVIDIDDSNILEILPPLVSGARRAQSELGMALEIEWVSELSGQLWFLQARPLEAQA